ncbi:hypothetical protein GCM10022212_03720 [Actimicrobium antarcticum]|uniref:Uncharacterized protein n=1 Tax=Actimicrobium antarcticum TaxID=1051899 RepID=A0ABP7SKH6_9BURK
MTSTPADAGSSASTPPDEASRNTRVRLQPPQQAERRGLSCTIGNQDRRDGNGLSALHRAIQAQDSATVRALLRLRADPNLRLPDQLTPLMLAASLGQREVVQALLEDRRLNVEARCPRSATALHHAARNGHTDIVRLLVDRGCDCRAARPNGFNALHIAAFQGHAGAVAVLMDAMPGQWNTWAHNGYSALHLATRGGHSGVISTMASQHAMDINQLTSFGYTALQLAAKMGHTRVIEAILGAPDVDVNAQTANHKTALQIAADLGHEQSVGALVGAAGIDVNRLHGGFDAALHLAAKSGHMQVLEKLLDTPGIDVNLSDQTGITALLLCSARVGIAPKEEVALRLLDHPDTDPNGAILLLGTSRRVLDYFRRKAGAPPTLSDRDFKIEELERWTHFKPRTGTPCRYATSITNAYLGKLLLDSSMEHPSAPAGARRDLDIKDAAFRLTLALEQSLQFHRGYSRQARECALLLLQAAPPEPQADPDQAHHYHNQFLIGGIAYPRSEIEDIAQAQGNYALEGELNNIAQQGWHANVHRPGFLLRGRDILTRLQERDTASLPMEDAIATINRCIGARATDAIANRRIQSALLDIEPTHAQRLQPVSDAARVHMASWISSQPEFDRAALQHAWRARLMFSGVQQTLSQDTEVDEDGLTITAPETLRLLQAHIQSLRDSTWPADRTCAGQLQDAVLERLYDIGNESRVCNTGCVQRLLDAPAGIDATLMAREPHDRAIFNEILRIGGIVNRAFDDQYLECDQGVFGDEDRLKYDEHAGTVRKDILRATTIDELVRRRGWRQPQVEAQLRTVLDAL